MPEAFPVEVNGPANIVMMLDISQALGKPVDLAAIRQEAVETIAYIEALGRGERPAWHQIKVPQ